MKNPKTETPVAAPRPLIEVFRDEEKQIRARADALEQEYRRKRVEWEGKREVAAGKFEAVSADLERLKAQFRELEAQVKAEVRQRLEARAMLKKDVESGKATFQEFFKTGTSEDEFKAQVKREATEKLRELLEVVRKKSREVLEAEIEVLRAENELHFMDSSPVLFWRGELAELVKRIDQNLGALIGGWPLCRTKFEERERQLKSANDSGPTGAETWFDLSREGLEELRFDPRVLPEYLPDLEKAIEGMGDGETVNVKIDYRRGPTHGFSIW